ncbi:WhiB family redox-sensing transcriptional regulator [Kitasatospora gansuensis]|uniref:WhiB family redox-sensing transcriptional regulator n=1 Tax=Kitasatospora gansuensis TaxID=258050 RepID=A0A7W7SEP6_9ACTN|nr:hypothetical protein [Kitasatospora gansuensis]MBB4948518.1 WhiB family redox-sensing transcriptional regulator [Kitasatospora gansuensis]
MPGRPGPSLPPHLLLDQDQDLDAGRPDTPVAACTGLPGGTVFATRYAQALPALLACGRCPLRAECEAAVDPANSWFDGVCGGRLWRNGRPIADSPELAASTAAPAA